MRTLALLGRLALGLVFLVAGLTKLLPPEHRYLFEIALSAHGLLSARAVIAVAATLPWVEVGLGLLLLAGWRARWTAAAATALLAAFFAVLMRSYLAGIQADCGCFGFGEPLSGWTLARDALLLAVAGLLTWRGEADAGARRSLAQ